MVMKKVHVPVMIVCAALGAIVLWLNVNENPNSREGAKLFNALPMPATHAENRSNKNIFTTGESAAPRNIATPAVYVATPDEIYIRLFDASVEERLKVLDMILQSTDPNLSSDKIMMRIEEMVADDDARIAELAQIALVAVQELRSADDMKRGLLIQNGSALSGYPETFESIPRLGGMSDAELEKSSTTSLAESPPIYVTQINDLDASVRERAIAEAMTQRDENAIDVFYKAIQDVDAKNRLLAIDGLQQILSTGLGDAQHIMAILGNATSDPDPQVASMARQAVSDF